MVIKEEVLALAFEELEMNIEPAIATLGIYAEPHEIIEYAQTQLAKDLDMEPEFIETVAINNQKKLFGLIIDEVGRWGATSYEEPFTI